MAASLAAQISAGIVGPTISLQAAGVLNLIATLELQIGALELALELAVSIDLLLGSSVAAYTSTGLVSDISADMGGILASSPPGPSTSQSAGIMLVGTTPAAIAALGELFI